MSLFQVGLAHGTEFSSCCFLNPQINFKCVFNAETKHLSGFYDSSLIQGRVKTVERLKTKSDLINFGFCFFFPNDILLSTEREKTPIPCAALIRNRQYYLLPISDFL